ncbi:MAG: hypothetical protein NTV21_14975 [Planctomycetota bacterium]|nr:hypothetical protein [Planctomycetota bacterium]
MRALAGALVVTLVFLVAFWFKLPSSDSARQSGPLFLVDPLVWMVATPFVGTGAILATVLTRRWIEPARISSVTIHTTCVVSLVTAVATLLVGIGGVLAAFVALIVSLRQQRRPPTANPS